MPDTTQTIDATGASGDVDFGFTPQQEELQRKAAEIARRLDPDVREPAQLERCFALLADSGLLGTTYGDDLGGLGGGWQEHAIVLAELAGRSDGLALAYHCTQTAPRLADDDELLRATVAGDGLTALAHREPGMGDDLAELGTAASVAPHGGFVLKGRKHPVVALPNLRWLVVTAQLEAGVGRFVVDAAAAGVRVEPLAMRGLAGCPLAEVVLEDVALTADALVQRCGSPAEALGELTLGWQAAKAVYEIRSAAAAVELVVQDAMRKMTFGKPLLKWQAIQFRLVDVQGRLDLLEPMAWYFTWLLDHPAEQPPAGLSRDAYASLLGLQTVRYVSTALETAVEIGGGRMFNEEHPLWRRYMTHLASSALEAPESVHVSRVVREL